MTALVLDASIAIAWTFADERTPDVLAVFERVLEEGAMVPTIWRLEVANVMRTALRRGRCDEDFVDRSLSRLGRLGIEVDEDTHVHAWGGTRKLSVHHGLTLYDAAYLELALRRGRPLATLDVELRHAARRNDVEVVG